MDQPIWLLLFLVIGESDLSGAENLRFTTQAACQQAATEIQAGLDLADRHVRTACIQLDGLSK